MGNVTGLTSFLQLVSEKLDQRSAASELDQLFDPVQRSCVVTASVCSDLF